MGSALFVFTICTFLFFKHKKIKGGSLTSKFFAGIFIAVFIARYYFYIEYPIDNIKGISQSPLSPALTWITVLNVAFSQTAFCILTISAFIKRDFAKLLAKYFCLPTYILSAILMPCTVKLLMGPSVSEYSFTAVMHYVEVAIGLFLSILEWIKDLRFNRPQKDCWQIIIALIFMIMCSFPSYGLQVLFGKGPAILYVDDFTETHRVFLYFAFIIPIIIYLALRNKEQATKRFAMVFISVSLLITYCTRFKFDSFLKPWYWPLHLCNTAMFIVPICLIFNAKKLFYFTYFINVMGAFLAMAMPNYENANIFDWALINFWINHYPAFFMPILLVALKVFDRPKIKQFYYSMVGFLVYFLVALFANVLFTAMGHDVDFFFINSNFIADKLGVWAENIFKITASVTVMGYNLEFHPLYQILFFIVYVAIALGIWFVYSECFVVAENLFDMLNRKKKIRIDKLAMQAKLNGRSIEEPMYFESGIQLKLNNFSKRYATSKHYAVKNASLTVNGGEVFGFLGPNGAGKSTIIKSIVGIQPITEGSIEICGYDCATQPKGAKAQIGFVPDHYALYEKLTGREYINYIADIYDVSEEDRTARIEEMVALFELEGAFDNSMKTYSHGMKQKITIMAALVHNPKLWILDEPLTGLDPNSIYQVKECMRRHAEAGNIVFFSSHIIDVVERICDRIAIIKKGTIMCVKTIQEIEKECPLEEFYLKTINDEEFAKKVLAGGVKT
ncbi:MAG: YwaF family protein [Clostridia bacterium]|nr:YwaF family protein [Clostridia bacterium]